MEEMIDAKTRLQVWDGRTLRPISRIAELPGGHNAGVIAYGPAADRLAVGCMQHVDKATLALGNAPVLIGSVTPDGILMFDYLGDHMSDVGAIAFSPDGAKLITGSCPLPGEAPAEMICWDVGTPSRPRWRVSYPAAVTAISVSPDGKRFVVGGADGLLRLFSIDQPLEAIAAANVGETVGSVAYAAPHRARRGDRFHGPCPGVRRGGRLALAPGPFRSARCGFVAAGVRPDRRHTVRQG